MKIVVLAGGGGTRLWPLSRQAMPKQFLSLFPSSPCSLLSDTINRALACLESNAKNLYVSTSEALFEQVTADLCQQRYAETLQKNILLEPCMRNTAPAIALIARRIAEAENIDTASEVLVVLPADHHIPDTEDFKKQVEKAERLAREGYIVTLGIEPTTAETGFGYIEVSQDYQDAPWLPVKRFVEKPSQEKAEAYVQSKRLLWNAGIFVLSFKTLFQSLEQYAPDIHQLINQGYAPAIEQYNDMPSISFDYAVMEHSRNTAVVPYRSGWSDVGSWDGLYALLSKDELGNSFSHPEQVLAVQSQGCLVQSQGKRFVGLLSMNDCFVIDTPDALLIGQAGSSQDVRSIVSHLSKTEHLSLQTPMLVMEPWGEIQDLNGENQDALPVYQLRLNPGQAVSLSLLDKNTLHVLGGTGLLSAHGKQSPLKKDDIVLTTNLAVLKANEDGLICLLIGAKPSIRHFHASDIMENMPAEAAV